VALVALAGALLGALVCRARLGARPALALVATLLIGDLAQAGSGLNPQAPPALFALLPELAAQRLDALDGGRVFSYALDESPAFRQFLAAGTPGRGLWSFFLSRQMLVPYASAIDAVETAHGKDLTSFVPRPPEMEPGELDPARAGAVLPRLREAAVVRVLSLDPLAHPELSLRTRAPAGPPGMWIHLYELGASLPRVTFEGGRWRALSLTASRQDYEVEAERAGELRVRDSHARGWRVWVDGREAAVRKVAGKHRAVSVPPGRHVVRFAYAPPGLRAGLALMALSVLATAALWRKPLV
jgi:hypothetical protein